MSRSVGRRGLQAGDLLGEPDRLPVGHLVEAAQLGQPGRPTRSRPRTAGCASSKPLCTKVSVVLPPDSASSQVRDADRPPVDGQLPAGLQVDDLGGVRRPSKPPMANRPPTHGSMPIG